LTEEKKTKTEDGSEKEVQEEEILKADFDSVLKGLLATAPEPRKKKGKK